jgi:hypothetical protein
MSKPDWWSENERLRNEFDLPPYEPPRFADGTHTYSVVNRVEDEFGCDVRFVGVDSRYGDDWHVRVDGESLFTVGRYRDENANTVYKISAHAFEQRIREQVDGDER